MVQDISGEGFDAYYVKIKQQALSYLAKGTVKFGAPRLSANHWP
mgnify:CR=1 FL=1